METKTQTTFPFTGVSPNIVRVKVEDSVKTALQGLKEFVNIKKNRGDKKLLDKYFAVTCNVCRHKIAVKLTGTIVRTSLLGEVFDWIKLDVPQNHFCMDREVTILHYIYKSREPNPGKNVPYYVYEDKVRAAKTWKTTPKISEPQGTELFTISSIETILEQDIVGGFLDVF